MTFYEIDKDGNKEELEDVHEARRIVGPRSFDDNWNPTGIYVSELRDSKDRFYAFVDFHGDESDGHILECPHCLEYGFHYKVGAKMLKHGEKPAPDHDQWTSCYECGNTFPLYQLFPETEIKDSEETTDNPFENESVFMSSRKKKYKDRRLNSLLDEDPEIEAEIKKGKVVNILYDSK